MYWKWYIWPKKQEEEAVFGISSELCRYIRNIFSFWHILCLFRVYQKNSRSFQHISSALQHIRCTKHTSSISYILLLIHKMYCHNFAVLLMCCFCTSQEHHISYELFAHWMNNSFSHVPLFDHHMYCDSNGTI